MANRLRQLTLVISALLLLAAVASATQVTLSESTVGQVKFANVKGDTTDVTFSFTGNCGEGGNNCVAGLGLYGSTLGSYKMWLTGGTPTLTAPDAFDIYGVDLAGATLHFSMQLGDSSLLVGQIGLEQLSGGSTRAPEFLGSFTPSFVSQDFLSNFAVGVTSPGDFTLTMGKSTNIDAVYSSHVKGMHVLGPISSGEILPGVPEPGSLALMGSGLMAMAGVLRRRLF